MTAALSNPVLQGAEDTLSPLVPTYARADVTIVRGNGVRVWDSDDREYLDFGAGIAVVGLGHGHPAPLTAARKQLDRLWHASNLYRTQPAEELARQLSSRFGGAQSFFCNSGAEAIEAGIKFARKSSGKAGVVALEGGFHGRTFGALSVTGQPGKREAFEPMLPGARFVPPNNVRRLREAVDDEVGLILLEPVLGEGGVRPLDAEFVAAAAELPALLCFDEIQTGVGRTGTFFAYEELRVQPDLVTLAKGLANGLPIGALLVRDGVAEAFGPGDHGSTFGGNPVSCSAACAVVDAIDDELLSNVRLRATQICGALVSLPGVIEIRGRGLLLGVELDRPAAAVVDACRERGLLALSAGDSVLRLTPPLVITEDDVTEALTVLAAALDATSDRIFC